MSCASSCQTNVFSGPNSLRDFYNPDKCPPLPMVELPEELNPFLHHGVRIYAKLMTYLPAANVKSLPALNMLMEEGIHLDHDSGLETPPLSSKGSTEGGHDEMCEPHKPSAIVEYSSGSTAISLGILSRIFGVEQAHTYLSNKTSAAKLSLLRFFGLELTLFGGPSQPLPTDHRGGIHAARAKGRERGFYNPDQYTNEANFKAHARWTGPQILRQLPQTTVVCAGMGTSGTMTGMAMYMKCEKPSTFCLGVCTAHGDRVPGPRQEAMLAPVKFPFRDVVDEIVDVTSKDAFSASMRLCRNGILAGPSSGLALDGIWQHIQRRLDDGALDQIRDPKSQQVHCVFICCDPPFQYVDEYFEKLGEDHFPPVHNSILINSDKYRYDDAWELDEKEARERIDNDATILGLRSCDSALPFSSSNLVRIPLQTASHVCPFADPTLLDAQWKEMEHTLDVRQLGFNRPSVVVVVICSTGGTSRVASSILRNRGVQAFSLLGGL